MSTYRIESEVEEKDTGPIFKVVQTGDEAGYVSVWSLFPIEGTWTKKYKDVLAGKPSIEIVDNDGKQELTINRIDGTTVKFQTDISEMSDLRTLLEIVERAQRKVTGRGNFSLKRIFSTSLVTRKEFK